MPIHTARQLSIRNFGETRAAIRVVRRIDGARRALAQGAVGVCLLALFGYALDLRALYIPVAGGGGTHPLTALVGLLLASARLSEGRRKGRLLGRGFAGLAMLALMLRALELAWPATPLPVGGWSGMGEARPGVEMGLNSLMGLAGVAIALLVRCRSVAGMAALVASFGICGIVIVAYSYALYTTLGGMSPVTSLIVLLLVLSSMGRHLDPMALRLVISRGSLSRMLRRQLLLALSGFWIGGLMLLQLEPAQWTAGAPLFVTVMLVLAAAGLMSSVAMLAGTENARQRQQAELERLSVTDALTGLANRHACDLFASQAVAAAQREGTGLAVVLIDIDRFKQVNDRYGHGAGDRILREVGHLLPRWLRRSDLAVRWGGEEFLLILSNTRLTGAMALAERLRCCFEAQLTLPDGSAPVTASIGCAELLPGEESIQAPLARADEALYRAKSGGRNRVEPKLPTPRDDSEDVADTGGEGRARRAADAV